jgi:hypothetical protein
MFFLVTTKPNPVKPSTMQENMAQFWEWIDPLVQDGRAKHVFTNVSRGAVIIFEVDSPEAMHKIINEWAECMPTTFEVTLLLPKKVQERAAFAGTSPMKP